MSNNQKNLVKTLCCSNLPSLLKRKTVTEDAKEVYPGPSFYRDILIARLNDQLLSNGVCQQIIS